MFAEASVNVDCDSARVSALLNEENGAWTVESALGNDVLSAIEPVRSIPGSRSGRTLVPVKWSPSAGSSPLSHMEGVVAIEPDMSGGSRVTVSVTFDRTAARVPGDLGLADLHRMAEATIRTFLSELAGRADSAAASRPERKRSAEGR
ncbi:MAG: hypothetical protein ACHQ0J_01720 [Candidatus Dormibacterales bacterium]